MRWKSLGTPASDAGADLDLAVPYGEDVYEWIVTRDLLRWHSSYNMIGFMAHTMRLSRLASNREMQDIDQLINAIITAPPMDRSDPKFWRYNEYVIGVMKQLMRGTSFNEEHPAHTIIEWLTMDLAIGRLHYKKLINTGIVDPKSPDEILEIAACVGRAWKARDNNPTADNVKAFEALVVAGQSEYALRHIRFS